MSNLFSIPVDGIADTVRCALSEHFIHCSGCKNLRGERGEGSRSFPETVEKKVLRNRELFVRGAFFGPFRREDFMFTRPEERYETETPPVEYGAAIVMKTAHAWSTAAHSTVQTVPGICGA